jgi:hypothetical protein
MMTTTTPPVNENLLTATSTRDLYTMHALQGILAAHSGNVAMPTPEEAAEMAVRYATATMLHLADTPAM